MKQEFSIQDEWLPFEIHSDTPARGVQWNDYFPGMDYKAFFQQLDARGADMGLRFGPQPLMSNSRQALEAGEYAKDYGRFDEYHEAVFQAFFTDLLNIGDREVLLDIARRIGIDAKGLGAALDTGIYLPRLKETTQKAKESGFTAAPTFVVGGSRILTGAQPAEVFRSLLQEVGSAL
jgi:predicted DsbA family dithiol-disulfide isomerase